MPFSENLTDRQAADAVRARIDWKSALGLVGNNPSRFKGNPNRPVESVSWYDVQAFLRKLNERDGGRDYRWSTEAQWEYACRAGTQTTRYDSNLGAIAWYGENSIGETHEVGQKRPNAWGLYDMLGNVSEWCYDGHRRYPYRRSKAGLVTDPVGSTDSVRPHRSFRGCCWEVDARYVRAAYRNWLFPELRNDGLGFRYLCSGPSK